MLKSSYFLNLIIKNMKIKDIVDTAKSLKKGPVINNTGNKTIKVEGIFSNKSISFSLRIIIKTLIIFKPTHLN